MKKMMQWLVTVLVIGLPMAPANAQNIGFTNSPRFDGLGAFCASACLGDPGLVFVSGATSWMEVGNATYSYASFDPTPGNVFSVNRLGSGSYGVFAWSGSALVGSALIDNNFNFSLYDGVVLARDDFAAAANVGAVVAPIPEPETYAMMLAGLAMLGYAGRRRQRKSA